jgi:uncharacterized protein YndB with AHSA1/START domain
MNRKIVVEAVIAAPVEEVWRRTQEPDLHLKWDIRFTTIRYLEELDERGFKKMDYRTRIGFGVEIYGTGSYLQNKPPHHSTFEFGSGDWKSLITLGKGIWLYEPHPEGTYFKTVYDYDTRYGALGRLFDRLLFRRVMQLATEWGFETLRRWCSGDEAALAARASRLRFVGFLIGRLFGKKTPPHAQSWLGGGQPAESRLLTAGNRE